MRRLHGQRSQCTTHGAACAHAQAVPLTEGLGVTLAWLQIGYASISSPVLRDRAYLDRAAQSGRGNARGKPDGRIEIVGFEHEITTHRAAGIDVGAVGDLRTAVAYAHGLRVLRQSERKAGRDAGGLIDLSVFRVDPLLLLLGQRLPGVGPGQGGSTLI